MRTKSRSIAVLAGLVILASLPLTASASHAWGTYHWARTSNPFTLKVVDSMTADWDDNLDIAIADWNSSSVMNLTEVPGDSTSTARKRCRAVTGQVRVCNASYGFNGWLGIATISLSGSHITKATAKMNDSYFASSAYNETARQHVVCQEIGHDFGLGHQDESGADLNTCMDYSNALDNPHPNAHDYAQLETIYAHFDSTTTISGGPSGTGAANAANAPLAWGRLVFTSADGSVSTFVRELGRGFRTITHVTWAR